MRNVTTEETAVSRVSDLSAIANGKRPCHGCGRLMTESMWSSAPATPGRTWERDCPDCANIPQETTVSDPMGDDDA